MQKRGAAMTTDFVFKKVIGSGERRDSGEKSSCEFPPSLFAVYFKSNCFAPRNLFLF